MPLAVLRFHCVVCGSHLGFFQNVIRVRQQWRMAFYLEEIAHGAVHALLTFPGNRCGGAIRVAGGTISRIAQSSYEES